MTDETEVGEVVVTGKRIKKTVHYMRISDDVQIGIVRVETTVGPNGGDTGGTEGGSNVPNDPADDIEKLAKTGTPYPFAPGVRKLKPWPDSPASSFPASRTT